MNGTFQVCWSRSYRAYRYWVCRRVYEPESEEEVVRLMQKAIGEGWQLRAVGSAISPNGLGFASKCMVSMAQMDKILAVDTDKKQVRLQLTEPS